ncbi:hypothetical protein FEM48_Zijuj02G0169500 [Ziziphus jujuba var. spinosa]|uniref:Uncharacterized protein n=1 Tax=Ziziphus jujuba var. spinosa TaxID=714518 RepID=A0A978VWV3_ZIZJJ|nr:hypothetical protein FEM48_Zijuj02G0169500 [Ziziphus jujuba var. spinosa]
MDYSSSFCSQYSNSEFSPQPYSSSFNSFLSDLSWAEEYSFNFNNQPVPLPFNENDSEEMLLYGVLAGGDSSESISNAHSKDVEESLKEMKYGYEEGSSPVLALKRRHSMTKKHKKSLATMSKNKKKKEMMENVVVLEDLGADYLEELLKISESTSPNYWALQVALESRNEIDLA